MSEYIYQADPIGEGQYHYTLVGELVRCGDCIHYMEINQPYPQMYCIKHNLDPRGDDYCSRGERRADDETD